MIRILLTSSGSLVSQNILDVLSYAGFSRRALVDIVGVNSLADSPSNFACDRCHAVPSATSSEFRDRLTTILNMEAPDLILCGRDEDVHALALLKRDRPGLPGSLPCPNVEATRIALDKWETAEFARRNGLPFADCVRASDPESLIEAFLDRVEFPFIAKPISGSGSRGVFFVRSRADLERLGGAAPVLLQKYIGNRDRLNDYLRKLERGPIPLHSEAPDPGHYSCQTIIGPDGAVGSIFSMYNQHSYGHTVENFRVLDEDVQRIAQQYAEAIAAEGATGPFNLQLRRHADGSLFGQEINLRQTGSTVARFLLGLDEIHEMVAAFLPNVAFPKVSPGERSRIDRVVKRYRAIPISDGDVESLGETGRWRSPVDPAEGMT
jgi:carbamoyl-phosphate synthase large subunit